MVKEYVDNKDDNCLCPDTAKYPACIARSSERGGASERCDLRLVSGSSGIIQCGHLHFTCSNTTNELFERRSSNKWN
jgi:hypothetical protein